MENVHESESWGGSLGFQCDDSGLILGYKALFRVGII